YRVEAVTAHPLLFPSDQENDPLHLEKLKDTEITLTINLEGFWNAPSGAITASGAGTREISGLVADVNVLGKDGDATVYEFVLRPWCWLATLGTNSRVFNGSITDILHKALQPYRGTIEWRISGIVDPSRDLIRQAWESDWNFFLRLCEEFGYVVWFEHRDRTHVLVIADHCGAYHKLGPAYETLRYHTSGGHINKEHITQLSYGCAVTLDTVTVHDHSYLSPRLNTNSLPYRESWHDSDGAASANHETYTLADYAQPRTRWEVDQNDTNWHDDARYLARVKLEAIRGRGKRAEGRGHLRGIESGKTFTLTHYPYSEANCEYLVLDCTLDIREGGITSNLVPEYSVEASFTLQPRSLAYRMPQDTPRPTIDGCEYAVIVGPQNAEMQIDEHNRVLIQYAWDREGGYDGRSSIWVRVAQQWQGDQMGTVMHGRCGQQVLV
ncbi:type VI secretion system tip protein VgrG, partial [Paraburkholderia silviterrae]